MAKHEIKIVEEGYVKYSLTTWQGSVEINGSPITYRYSEDDNGAELYILNENQTEWERADEENVENHKVLWVAIQAWGSPEEMGTSGDYVDLEEEEFEDYI